MATNRTLLALVALLILAALAESAPAQKQRLEKRRLEAAHRSLHKFCKCPFVEKPACGMNGVTYTSPCIMKCLGVREKHAGLCNG